MIKKNFITALSVENLLPLAGVCIVLFIFLPLTVYVFNLRNVLVQHETVLQSGLTVSAVFILGVIIFSAFSGAGAFIEKISITGILIIFIFTVFPNRLYDFIDLSLESNFLNIAISIKFLAAVAAVIYMLRRYPHATRIVARAVILVTLLVIIWYLIFLKKHSTIAGITEQSDIGSAVSLGTEENIIVIVLDTFSGYRMEELLQQHPELARAFSGFTLYPNAIASAQNTKAGIAAILTGSLDVSLSKTESGEINSDNTILNSFIMDSLSHGFEASYISSLSFDVEISTRIKSYVPTEFYWKSANRLVTKLSKYSGFFTTSLYRILPSYASRFIERLVFIIFKSLTTEENIQRIAPEWMKAELGGKLVFRRLINKINLGTQPKKILFFHSYIVHSPFVFTETGYFSFAASSLSTSVYTVKLTKDLIEKIKTSGVYDKSLIIICSDHGGLDCEDRTFKGNIPDSCHTWNGSSFNPLVMIKNPDSSGPVKVNDMSVWLGDIWATVKEHLGETGYPARAPGVKSLFKPESYDPARNLDVPIFFPSPSSASAHSTLDQWIRVDLRGKFSNYMQAHSMLNSFELINGKEINLNIINQGKGFSMALSCDQGRLFYSEPPQKFLILEESNIGMFPHFFVNTDIAMEYIEKAVLSDSNIIIMGVGLDPVKIKKLNPGGNSPAPAEGKQNLIYVRKRGKSSPEIFSTGNGNLSALVKWE